MQDCFNRRRVDGVDRDRAMRGLQGARDARVAAFAQRSHRHRLPPRTDDYVPSGKRTEGSPNPGHAPPHPGPTGAKAAAINDWKGCTRDTGEHWAYRSSLDRSPR